MKILVDMNLSPQWVQSLEGRGFSAIHWSSVGDGGAPDSAVLGWARDNGYVVFTNDLDFGAILAITKASAPSVIRVRVDTAVAQMFAPAGGSKRSMTVADCPA